MHCVTVRVDVLYVSAQPWCSCVTVLPPLQLRLHDPRECLTRAIGRVKGVHPGSGWMDTFHVTWHAYSDADDSDWDGEITWAEFVMYMSHADVKSLLDLTCGQTDSSEDRPFSSAMVSELVARATNSDIYYSFLCN
jgi:hypothetical protein